MDPRMLMMGGPPVAPQPGVVPMMPEAPVAGPEQVDPMMLLAMLAASAPRKRRPSAPALSGRGVRMPSARAVQMARNTSPRMYTPMGTSPQLYRWRRADRRRPGLGAAGAGSLYGAGKYAEGVAGFLR